MKDCGSQDPLSRPRLLLLYLPLLCFLCLAHLLTPAEATEWKGRRIVKDGVLHVMNPAEPMEPPAVYELRELWRLESETEDGDLVFGTVNAIAEDEDGNIYLLDTQLKTVHLISPEGNYLRSIGRGGEGPGELNYPTQMFLADDGRVCILDRNAGNLTFLTRDGQPSGEWLPKLDGYNSVYLLGAHAVPNGYAVVAGAKRFAGDIMTDTKLIGVFDSAGHVVARAAEQSRTRIRGERFVYDEDVWDAYRFLEVTADEKLLISCSYRDYRIDVHDLDGSVSMVIHRDYQPVERSEEELTGEKEYWEGYFRRYKNPKIEISPYERTIASVEVRADGSFWVGTSHSWRDLPEGVAEVLDAFSKDGLFVRQIVLRKDISPENDYLYYLEDKVLVSTGGASAELAAVGGASGNSEEAGLGNEAIPAAILCEMVRVQ
ncbi:MAG: hypothetical protein KAY24_03735 [Candidatus Eisenbacteria sp.]|nr:hypothetical protein [Candidatus Eisenbacteria bacterium]